MISFLLLKNLLFFPDTGHISRSITTYLLIFFSPLPSFCLSPVVVIPLASLRILPAPVVIWTGNTETAAKDLFASKQVTDPVHQSVHFHRLLLNFAVSFHLTNGIIKKEMSKKHLLISFLFSCLFPLTAFKTLLNL